MPVKENVHTIDDPRTHSLYALKELGVIEDILQEVEGGGWSMQADVLDWRREGGLVGIGIVFKRPRVHHVDVQNGDFFWIGVVAKEQTTLLQVRSLNEPNSFLIDRNQGFSRGHKNHLLDVVRSAAENPGSYTWRKGMVEDQLTFE